MQTPTHGEWTPVQKFLFRFSCCFFLIYIFPFPLDSIPFTNEISSWHEKLIKWYFAVFDFYSGLWHKLIPWVGEHILRLQTKITIFTNGSGDTTYDYVVLLTYFSLAVFAAIIWTVIDKNRKSYNTAYQWLRILVRYYVGSMMLVYGIIKIFHLQMPSPGITALVQPFGDKSPMGVAWSFVGSSKAFSAFTGWAETISGILLFFRRTTTLGALLGATVMGNIVAINFCYDVPVKLFSSVLFLMLLFLVAPDARRLLNILFLNKSTEPIDTSFNFNKRWQRVTRVVLKWAFILYAFYSNISTDIKSEKIYGDTRPKVPLYGLYHTVMVIRNKDTVPPLTTDTTRWKRLAIEYTNFAQIQLMNDSASYYHFIPDTASKTVTIYSDKDTANKSKFIYLSDSNYLSLRGRIKNDSVYIRFRRFDLNAFRLLSRGFHWVNEYPYNR